MPNEREAKEASPEFPAVRVTIKSLGRQPVAGASVTMRLLDNNARPVVATEDSGDDGVAINRVLPYGKYYLSVKTEAGWFAIKPEVMVEFGKGLNLTIMAPDPDENATLAIDSAFRPADLSGLRFGQIQFPLGKSKSSGYGVDNAPEPGVAPNRSFATFPTLGDGIDKVAVALSVSVYREVKQSDGTEQKWSWSPSADEHPRRFLLTTEGIYPIADSGGGTSRRREEEGYFAAGSNHYNVGYVKFTLGDQSELPLSLSIPAGRTVVYVTGVVGRPNAEVRKALGVTEESASEQIWLRAELKRESEWTSRLLDLTGWQPREAGSKIILDHLARQEQMLRNGETLRVRVDSCTQASEQRPKTKINSGTSELDAVPGIRVRVLLSAQTHSREMLRKNIGFDQLSIMGAGITGTVNGQTQHNIQAVIADRCRLESFEETEYRGEKFWDATLFVPQDRTSDGSNFDLSQMRLEQMREQGVQFWLDHHHDQFPRGQAPPLNQPGEPDRPAGEPNTPSLAAAPKQFNEDTDKVRKELFAPPIPDLTAERLREGFRQTANRYRHQGKHQLAQQLENIAESGYLPKEASSLIATGAHGQDEAGRTISRQVVPGFTLPDNNNSGRLQLIVLRPLELIYRQDGPVSKDYGDLFDEEQGERTQTTERHAKLQGTVTELMDQELVEISIGADDGLRAGDTLIIFRDKTYLGKISVQRTAADKSVARIESRKGDIRRGDLVSTTSEEKGPGTVKSSSKRDELRFSETHELVLSMNSMKFMLDLDTGKTMDPPATRGRPEQKQMDVHTDQMQPYHYPKELIGHGLQGVEVKASDWDASAAEVRRALAGDAVGPLKRMDLGPEKKPTYFFKTHDGALGVLQLLEIVDEPKGIRLRYKTVKTEPGRSPARWTSAPSTDTLDRPGAPADSIPMEKGERSPPRDSSPEPQDSSFPTGPKGGGQ